MYCRFHKVSEESGKHTDATPPWHRSPHLVCLMKLSTWFAYDEKRAASIWARNEK